MISVGEFFEYGAVELSLKDGPLVAEKSILTADDGLGVAPKSKSLSDGRNSLMVQ
jgi:hypothetical protein